MYAIQEADEEDIFELDTVFVTAEKTVEKSVQKTPIAMSVVDSEELKVNAISSAADLGSYLPNLHIAKSSNAMEIAIRGIGSSNNSEVGDPAAAFSIDGVVYARPESAGVAFYDVQRVEVLRGPQGTLYGRNTIAGSLNVITNKPNQVKSAELNFGYGSYGQRELDGFVNLPLGELWALRTAFYASSQDGYIDNSSELLTDAKDYGWGDSKSARVHLIYQPDEDFSMLFTVHGSRLKGAWNSFVLRPVDGSAPGYEVQVDYPNLQDESHTTANVEISNSWGAVSMSYLGSYSEETVDSILTTAVSPLPDPAFVSGPNINRQDLRSHELRFSTKEPDRLEWVAGLFLFEENNDVSLVFPEWGIAFLQPDVLSESKAVFGQATWKLTERSRLIGGLRFTRDRKAREGGQFTVLEDGSYGVQLSVNSADREWDSSDYKFGWEYDLRDESLFYATISTGFKAGGFFDGTGDVYYEPEEIEAREVGMKNRFLEGRLQANFSVFDYDYTNFQVTNIEQNAVTGELGTVTRNAEKIPVRGLEFESLFQLGKNEKLSLNLTWLDARFDTFELGATDLSGDFLQRDLSGNQLAKASEWTVQFSYSKIFEFENQSLLRLRFNSRYNSGYYLSYDNFPLPPNPVDTWQPAFTSSDLVLTYEPSDRRYYCSLSLKNLEDELVMTSSGGNANGIMANLSMPRTWGVRIGAKY
ncbi:TonB-dependent receptor [Pelagicoccus albus]|uniref:TonB-dependent receptor n=1 Tax=Pelagicoccus albus TaxID=415222 RepID=A0A7X1B855_9BACT|nr:TonB-dependent receptor [Pelagicoccus albus]MBC2606150.1 TonB-dependent receptor [Pelagicoccus albus]